MSLRQRILAAIVWAASRWVERSILRRTPGSPWDRPHCDNCGHIDPVRLLTVRRGRAVQLACPPCTHDLRAWGWEPVGGAH